MGKKRETEIARISREAWKTAEALVASVSDTHLPVPLATIAKSLGVRCIRFEALISDIGLAMSTEGFDIVVNTEAPGVRETAGTTLSVDDGRWDELRPSLRFSVAHELAHRKLSSRMRQFLLQIKLY